MEGGRWGEGPTVFRKDKHLVENKQEIGEMNGSLGLNEYQVCVNMVTGIHDPFMEALSLMPKDLISENITLY